MRFVYAGKRSMTMQHCIPEISEGQTDTHTQSKGINYVDNSNGNSFSISGNDSIYPDSISDQLPSG